MKDPKRLSLRDNHIWLIFLKLHQMFNANNHATYYPCIQGYEEFNLIFFNGVQSVFWNIDRKALSVWDKHIDSFFTTTHKCFLRINKQLINLDNDDMKNLT